MTVSTEPHAALRTIAGKFSQIAAQARLMSTLQHRDSESRPARSCESRFTAPAVVLAFIAFSLLIGCSEAGGAAGSGRSALGAGSATLAGLGAMLSTVASSLLFRGRARRVQRAMRLGPYTIERKIGEGGMGIVYLARHAWLRRRAAIKVLQPERTGAGALARFEREIQLTSALRHPNTIAIYDYGRTLDGSLYYAMEYLEGATLEDVVAKSGPLTPARAAHVLRGVCSALAEAHARGFVHRDIKPSNVFLCDGELADHVKVLDFGLVKNLNDVGRPLTAVNKLLGTPEYLAPESIAAPERVDCRTDLYAVGALGYFLLTGRPPFTGATLVEICSHQLHSRPEPPSSRIDAELPPGLEALVLRCLEKDAALRPAHAGALLEALNALEVRNWSNSDAREAWLARRADPGTHVGSELGTGEPTLETPLR